MLVIADISAEGGWSNVGDLSANSFAVTFTDDANGDRSSVRVGTVSGTTITMGTTVEVEDSASGAQDISQLADNVFVQSHEDAGANRAVVGTVSGSTITAGTTVQAFAFPGNLNSSCKLSSTKFLIVCENADDDLVGIVGTYSGTTISSFGSLYEITDLITVAASRTSTKYLTTDKAVTCYVDGTNTVCKIITASGTNLSAGAGATVLNAGVAGVKASVAVLDSTHFVVAYVDTMDSNKGKVQLGTVDGTTITLSDTTTFDSGNLGTGNQTLGIAYVGNNKIVIGYIDTDHRAIVGDVTLPSTDVSNVMPGFLF